MSYVTNKVQLSVFLRCETRNCASALMPKFAKLQFHTLLPAIETTDVIGNTENKQVKRNMSKYFQRMFMLISLRLVTLTRCGKTKFATIK